MASPQAIVNKRTLATMRLQKLLDVQFKPMKAGSEYQHAADLEAIADALERREASRSSKTLKAAKAETSEVPA